MGTRRRETVRSQQFLLLNNPVKLFFIAAAWSAGLVAAIALTSTLLAVVVFSWSADDATSSWLSASVLILILALGSTLVLMAIAQQWPELRLPAPDLAEGSL